MEGLVNPDPGFWSGRRVFLTGHTGFKGSWLSILLRELGATVCGYALNPPTTPSLFVQADLAVGMQSTIGDIRDYDTLRSTILQFRPEVVIHMAAQPLVRESYRTPRETYETNVMGTVNLLEAVRFCESVRSVVVVTTDKVYENREWGWGYREIDTLGGHDPYSNSKAAAELVTASYRSSFFGAGHDRGQPVNVATARAGNVIGGGDWAANRLLPDIIRAHRQRETLSIRNPAATRPWQHVLEPLHGYLILAERLFARDDVVGAWNFGPRETDAKTVRWVVEICRQQLRTLNVLFGEEGGPHEAGRLKLDISKAEAELGWAPRWPATRAIEAALVGYQAMEAAPETVYQVCVDSIHEYLE